MKIHVSSFCIIKCLKTEIFVLGMLSYDLFMTKIEFGIWNIEYYFMFGSFHFRNFVFSYFGHFSCVIFLKFVSVLNFCLAHLALLSKKVSKHDYVIFCYFRNFVDQNKKLNGK